MIIADFLQISISLLIVLDVIICLLLLGIILMQRPKQEGLGAAFGSAITDQAFGARTTDILQKGTVYLGTMFFIVSFILSLLIVRQSDQNKSSLGKMEADTPAGEIAAPDASDKPVSNEELMKMLEEAQKAAEETPEKTEEQPASPAEQPVAPKEEETPVSSES